LLRGPGCLQAQRSPGATRDGGRRFHARAQKRDV